MPTPDTRPTVNFGTRYNVSKTQAAKAKAAADLRAGQARAEAAEYTKRKAKRNASEYRKALTKTPPVQTGGTSLNLGPKGRQFRGVE